MAREAVEEQIKKTCDAIGITLGPSQQNEIRAAMIALTFQMGLFGGLHGESVSYQFNIAEAPAAVTWKEFDGLLRQWEGSQIAKTVETWIGNHAGGVERSELDVYRELLQAAVKRYAEVLRRADSVFAEADKTALVNQASSLFALLETLVFELGNLSQTTKQIGNAELETFVDKFASFASSSMPVHSQFWTRNEAFILRLFDQRSPDVMPLIRLLRPYTGQGLRNFVGPAASELRKKLCGVVLPHFARQVVCGFHQNGFVERIIPQEEDTIDTVYMIWDVNGQSGACSALKFFRFWVKLPQTETSRRTRTNSYIGSSSCVKDMHRGIANQWRSSFRTRPCSMLSGTQPPPPLLHPERCMN
jgi:hypothetical protein